MPPPSTIDKPLKSKLGCQTCKVRRVKCGEEKPSCLRCTKTGRTCQYSPTRETDLTRGLSVSTQTLSSIPDTAWRERRAFAYYFEFAAASLGGSLDVEFWRSVVPRVCRSEPAVWDAMICISALFESPEVDFGGPKRITGLSTSQKDALDWYARSVSGVRAGIGRGSVDAFVGLITCVLFICIESLLGSLEEVMRLYAQGVQLIATLREQKAYDKLALLRETIIPIFIRLGIFSPQAVWPFAESLLAEVPHEDHGKLSISKLEFSSLKSAREVIVVLSAEIAALENACEQYLQGSRAWYISEDLMARQQSLHNRLSAWHSAFTNMMKYLNNTKEGLDATQTGISALLLTYYEMLTVILSVCVSPIRISTDAHNENFRTIVEQASIAMSNSLQNGSLPPYTFEISVGMPLWFTCLRCREPTIRRTALALLQSTHKVQGLSKLQHGTALVEKIITLEEAHATLPAQEPAILYSDMASPSSPLKAPLVLSSPSPPLTVDLEHHSLFIPQEARIRPHGVFRPADGYPPGTCKEDFAHWGRSEEQFYMEFSWNECHGDEWRMAFGYVPIDMMP